MTNDDFRGENVESEPTDYRAPPHWWERPGWQIIFIGIACWLIACAFIWAGIWIAGGWR